MLKLVQATLLWLLTGATFALQLSGNANHIPIAKELLSLEKEQHVKVGVYVIDTNSGKAKESNAKVSDAVVKEVTQVLFDKLAAYDPCFKATSLTS